MKKLIAYKGDAKLKSDFLREIKKHREADAVVQGTYGKQNGSWHGCAVACSLRSLAILDGEELKEEYADHALYETKLGIPKWLARLEDVIFEGLPAEDAKLWPEQFAEAISVGANLNPVKWQFCAFVLKGNIERVLKLDITDALKEQVVKSIQGVLALHESAIKTGEWDEAAWSAEAARSAAWSAARSAAAAARSAAAAARSAAAESAGAWSAARSAAWSAARSAEAAARSAGAWSAAEAAWSAARSAARSAEAAAESAAARSAAWSAARSAEAYQTYAKELLRLLVEAK